MILPPLVLDVRVREAGKRGFRIWLPLVLLWPLLFVLLALTLAVTLIADLVMLLAGQRYHHFTLLVLGCMKVLAETRDTHVRAITSDSTIYVDIV